MNPNSIVAIRGNVKQKINTPVAPFTAFVGDNRTGKTAHGDVIKLCMTAKHPVGPHVSDLLTLSSDPAGLFAQIVFGDGSTRTFRAQPGVTLNNVQTTPGAAQLVTDGSWPVDLIATLTTGATKAREALVKRFGKRMITTPPKTLTPRQSEMWAELMAKVKAELRDADAAQLLSGLSEQSRLEKLALGRTAAQLARTAASRRGEAETEAEGSDQIEIWRDMLVQARAYEREAPARADHAAKVAEYDTLQTNLRGWREELTKLEARRDDLVAHEQRAREADLDAKQTIAEMTTKIARIEWLISSCRNSPDACPVCTTRISMRTKLAEYEALLEQRKASRDEAEAKLAANVAAQMLAKQIADLDTKIVELRQNIERAETSSRPVRPAFVSYEGPSAEVLEGQIERAVKARAALDAVHEIERSAAITTERQAVVKVIEETATRQLQKELQTVVKIAEDIVNPYLPDGFVARCSPETGLWSIESRGGLRGKGTWSGAEQTSLLIGLVLAWTEDEPVRVLYLDDAQLAPYSPSNIPKLCAQLQEQIEAGTLTNVFLSTTRGQELPPFVQQVHMEPARAPAPSVLITADDI